MFTNSSIQITGAHRAADLIGLQSVTPIATPIRTHAPSPSNPAVRLGWPEAANDDEWAEIERRMAAREAARFAHPAGSGRRDGAA